MRNCLAKQKNANIFDLWLYTLVERKITPHSSRLPFQQTRAVDPAPHYFWKLDPDPLLSEKLDPGSALKSKFGSETNRIIPDPQPC
jgi:hypothetical protein